MSAHTLLSDSYSSDASGPAQLPPLAEGGSGSDSPTSEARSPAIKDTTPSGRDSGGSSSKDDDDDDDNDDDDIYSSNFEDEHDETARSAEVTGDAVSSKGVSAERQSEASNRGPSVSSRNSPREQESHTSTATSKQTTTDGRAGSEQSSFQSDEPRLKTDHPLNAHDLGDSTTTSSSSVSRSSRPSEKAAVVTPTVSDGSPSHKHSGAGSVASSTRSSHHRSSQRATPRVASSVASSDAGECGPTTKVDDTDAAFVRVKGVEGRDRSGSSHSSAAHGSRAARENGARAASAAGSTRGGDTSSEMDGRGPSSTAPARPTSVPASSTGRAENSRSDRQQRRPGPGARAKLSMKSAEGKKKESQPRISDNATQPQQREKRANASGRAGGSTAAETRAPAPRSDRKRSEKRAPSSLSNRSVPAQSEAMRQAQIERRQLLEERSHLLGIVKQCEALEKRQQRIEHMKKAMAEMELENKRLASEVRHNAKYLTSESDGRLQLRPQPPAAMPPPKQRRSGKKPPNGTASRGNSTKRPVARMASIPRRRSGSSAEDEQRRQLVKVMGMQYQLAVQSRDRAIVEFEAAAKRREELVARVQQLEEEVGNQAADEGKYPFAVAQECTAVEEAKRDRDRKIAALRAKVAQLRSDIESGSGKASPAQTPRKSNSRGGRKAQAHSFGHENAEDANAAAERRFLKRKIADMTKELERAKSRGSRPMPSKATTPKSVKSPPKRDPAGSKHPPAQEPAAVKAARSPVAAPAQSPKQPLTVPVTAGPTKGSSEEGKVAEAPVAQAQHGLETHSRRVGSSSSSVSATGSVSAAEGVAQVSSEAHGQRRESAADFLDSDGDASEGHGAGVAHNKAAPANSQPEAAANGVAQGKEGPDWLTKEQEPSGDDGSEALVTEEADHTVHGRAADSNTKAGAADASPKGAVQKQPSSDDETGDEEEELGEDIDEDVDDDVDEEDESDGGSGAGTPAVEAPAAKEGEAPSWLDF